MKCSLSECEWYAFGSCCPESEEMYNEVIPNNDECPHYYDLKTAAENERKEMINSIFSIFEEIGHPLNEKQKDEISSLRGMDLWRTYEDVFNLYEKHKQNEFLGKVLNEIDTYGIEWVKAKYELNK
jgi:hypothetical protein